MGNGHIEIAMFLLEFHANNIMRPVQIPIEFLQLILIHGEYNNLIFLEKKFITETVSNTD